MNPNDWIYHLSLRSALHQDDFLDPYRPARGEREGVHPLRSRRVAIAGAALLAPALLITAALLGG